MPDKRNLDFAAFEWITFDCYGTLIDWEAGIKGVLHSLLDARQVRLGSEKLLELYAELEAEIECQSKPYISYRDVLAQVVAKIGERFGFVATQRQMKSLPESLPSWKPFPDTISALRRLKKKYKLGIISNTDDDLFAASAKHLEGAFDMVVTAQQARSYKPALNIFLLAIKQARVSKTEILHAGQSVYHDIIPAQSLGLANVWVNRRSSRNGSGATKSASAIPDVEVPDLKSLAALAMLGPSDGK
jgi:2-haloacid dehalogenase